MTFMVTHLSMPCCIAAIVKIKFLAVQEFSETPALLCGDPFSAGLSDGGDQSGTVSGDTWCKSPFPLPLSKQSDTPENSGGQFCSISGVKETVF